MFAAHFETAFSNSIIEEAELQKKLSTSTRQCDMNEEASRLEYLHSKAHFNVLDDNLKDRLKSFVVKDVQGTLVGKVKDLYRAPNGQLNLIVSARQSEQSNRYFLLNSNLVHNVDSIARSVSVILSARRIEQLLEYVTAKMDGVKLSKDRSLTAKDDGWLVSILPEAIAQPTVRELR